MRMEIMRLLNIINSNTMGIRKMNDKLLKTAFSEFYLSLIMTQNYVKHNLQGFQKIMKKFDKNLNCKVPTTIISLLLISFLQDGAQWQLATCW